MFQDSSTLGRVANGIARWMALAGGLVLLAMIAIVVISVIGRAFIWAGLKPILGDYELISVGMGFAIFAFLPWAHISRGHALVSLVTDAFSARVNAWILVITDLVMLLGSAFIAWRLWLGMLDKFSYRETTILLGTVDGVGLCRRRWSARSPWCLWPLYVLRSLDQRCPGRPCCTQACGERPLTTNLILGLLGIPVVLILVFLRLPIGLAMMVVGIVGTWLVTKNFNPVMSQFKTLDLQHLRLALAVGGAAVPADGAVRHPQRAVDQDFHRGYRLARASQGRRRHGGNRRQRRLWLHRRLVAGDSRHNGQGGAARAQEIWLFR